MSLTGQCAKRDMSVNKIVGAAQILPRMGSKLPHLYVCVCVCDICPKMSDPAPNFKKLLQTFWWILITASLPQRDLVETCHVLQTGSLVMLEISILLTMFSLALFMVASAVSCHGQPEFWLIVSSQC